MFFPLFESSTPNAKSDLRDLGLPPRVLYLTEYWTGQILLSADEGFLRQALGERRIADALYYELEFLGQVPKESLPAVKSYISSFEEPLELVTGQLLRNPDSSSVRRQLTARVNESETVPS